VVARQLSVGPATSHAPLACTQFDSS
jgi:hypothetical protein